MGWFHSVGGLMKAVQKNDKDEVAKYLKWDKAQTLAMKDRSGDTALISAVEYGYTDLVRMLLDAGGNVNEESRYETSLLETALARHKNDIAALLIERGADVNHATRHYTPLIHAINADNVEGTQLLLKAKVDPGESALLTAIQRNNVKIPLMLLEAGAKVDAHDGYYRYPVHFAGQMGAIDTMKALIEKGANIDIQDNQYGYTPLHYAIVQGHPQMVQLLLEKGARTDLVSNDGKTALDMAYEKRIPGIIRMLDPAGKGQPVAAAAATPAAPFAPTIRVVSGDAEESEGWVRMGSSRVAHVGVYPAVGRKLTEIFNFAGRERIVITENLKTGAENMSAPESFDAIGETSVREALHAFRQLGGVADEDAVLNPRGMKKQLRQP